MSDRMIDTLARRLATVTPSRHGVLRLGAAAALAGLALAENEAAAVCRAPKKACGKGNQCCTGKCKQGKCATCANGAAFLPEPDPMCWLSWGGLGGGNGEFGQPFGVAVGRGGRVYVTEALVVTGRVQAFDATGGFVLAWGRGQFLTPSGVAVGGGGHVYVADAGIHRIQEFEAGGGFVRRWGRNGGDGSSGSGDGEFSSPVGIAADAAGKVYVADTLNHRIQEFDATGGFVRAWGGEGSGEGQFAFPLGVAVGGNGHVYVADAGNSRVQEFDDTGGFVRAWGGEGSGEGQFNAPKGVAVGGNGRVYVTDSSNHRVQEFTAVGAFVRAWGGFGSGDGQFLFPSGVAVGGGGNVYVVDQGNYRIVRVQPL